LSTFSKRIAFVILMSALATAADAASQKLTSIADSVPKFDMARECRAEGGSTATLDACTTDEAAARNKLQPLWSQSSAAEKTSCLGETSMDGTPSYVELQICLDMARDAKKLSK
jgi:hypothetical protein